LGFEHRILGDKLLEEEEITINKKGMQRDAHNIILPQTLSA